METRSVTPFCENKLELLMRRYKGGGGGGGQAVAPPRPAPPPRLGDQQARQVETVRREQSVQRRRGFSSTILTLGEDTQADQQRKTLLGQ